MFNIQKAVGRLDFAPKQKEIEITDIKKGLGVFVPPTRVAKDSGVPVALKNKLLVAAAGAVSRPS